MSQGEVSRWDECWECPRCRFGWAMGDGCDDHVTVRFVEPPRCNGCEVEMEQVTSIGIDPPTGQSV